MIKILKYGEAPVSEILSKPDLSADVEKPVAEILQTVRKKGDEALFAYTERFDGVRLSALEVTGEEMDKAFDEVSEEFLDILREAAGNIRFFHEKQVRIGFMTSEREGIILGQKIIPIAKVGIYVPGGTAAYPSTVLMDAIPAKIAGCSEIVMVTPPGKDGNIKPEILAAARIAGVDRVFRIGGAQAIGALAFGTQSVPKVDKIVGPGNAFVTEAKKQVFGRVSIDMIAGPSDILVVADTLSDPVVVAADMLSQAEHDKNSSAVLVTDSAQLAQKVQEELERQLSILPREAIARVSIENNGKIIVTEGDLSLAMDIANEIAPEHLELCVENPFVYLGMVRNAGSVFLGRNCPEVLGDYMAGPNHTLPTSGTARFSSALSVDDFIKKTQFTYYSDDALGRIADKIALFARKEGLEAHARSATVRFEKK